jgi:hypothetical protein
MGKALNSAPAFLFRLEFFAAEFFQCRKIVVRQLPHDGRGDAFVADAFLDDELSTHP